MMKTIPLTHGKVVLVDDADYEWLNQFRWLAGKYYAYRFIYKKIFVGRWKKRGQMILMHRFILGLDFGDKQHTDHVDGNGFNNQRDNLRKCTPQQNHFNRKATGGSSKFKGVRLYCNRNYPDRSYWRAQIVIDGKYIHIGTFDSEIEAAQAYDNKAMELVGELARLNV